MLRIGYLINQYPKPSHTFIRNEMQELERLGHRVARLAVRGWEDRQAHVVDAEEQARTEYLLKGGVLPLAASVLQQLITSPGSALRAMFKAWQLGRRSQAGMLKHFIYLAEACWTVRWSNRHGIQHLHAHFGTNTAAVATLTNMLSGLPFSFTVHGPDEFDAPRELKLKEKAEAAAFVVAITSYCRSQLFRWVDPSHWSKVKVVRCTPGRAFLEAEPTRPNGIGKLICVGRLCEQKGQLTLIQSMKLLIDEGFDVSLVLAGDGPMRGEVEEAIAGSDLQDRVTITGWIDSERVKEELLRADALVLPSFAEGLPIVVMEAMALGRPVLSTIIAGIPELVRNGVDGYLVPAGDSQLFAGAVAQYLRLSEADRATLANNCRERVRTLHDPAKQAALLAELIGNPGLPTRGSAPERA